MTTTTAQTQMTNLEARAAGLTHIASSDRKCTCCGKRIKKGEFYQQYRERALSYREAMHAGTMYPTRHRCQDCVTRPAGATVLSNVEAEATQQEANREMEARTAECARAEAEDAMAWV